MKRHRGTVRWSKEDDCYVGLCPELFWGGVHGTNKKKVRAQLDGVIRDCSGWHDHFFSPLCTDEVHGRFDAAEDFHGTYVLNVGSQRVVKRCRTRKEALAVAKKLAAAWRRRKK